MSVAPAVAWGAGRAAERRTALLQWFHAEDRNEAQVTFNRRVESIVEPMLVLLEHKHTMPVDERWVNELTKVARDLSAIGLQMPV